MTYRSNDMTARSMYCFLFRTVLSKQAKKSDGTVTGHFPDESLQSKHLAYVKWFSHLRARPEPHHSLYKVTCNPQPERRCGEVIEVSRISQSVQLFPCFSGSWRVDWNTDNVLEKCDTFLVNSLQNRHTYLVLS